MPSEDSLKFFDGPNTTSLSLNEIIGRDIDTAGDVASATENLVPLPTK